MPDAPALQTDALAVNALAVNALAVNALAVNALAVNALAVNALTSNPLTKSSLTGNMHTRNALEDPNAREVLEYIVSCALPAGQSFSYKTKDGTSHDVSGALGLAPEWGQPHGECNEICQQWVSGCVLSRVNYLGEHVKISLRGLNPALAVTWPEYTQYTQREAAYYGNIFSQPRRFLGCLPKGVTKDTRVCGPSVDDCIIDFQGTCEDVCLGSSLTGGYINCRGPMDNVLGDAWGWKMPYLGSVTVYLDP
ncbi:Dienelactone hydrolase family protein [Minicystis rosea]|nr:Dienelactone hydrolase family protein [Minicystis rosea]